MTVITGTGVRTDLSGWEGRLYKRVEYNKVPVTVKAIPYYAWANRGSGEMIVWIREC